jgi:hypothetical protein
MLPVMTELAKELAAMGYTLRSGAAEGPDSAFEAGAGNKKNIFPGTAKTGERELKIAREVHPNVAALDRSKNPAFVWNLMARNTNQVFGKNLDTPVDFVLAYTPDNLTDYTKRTIDSGGTGQAIDMASRKGIPVINMADPNWRSQLDAVLNKQNAPAQGIQTPVEPVSVIDKQLQDIINKSNFDKSEYKILLVNGKPSFVVTRYLPATQKKGYEKFYSAYLTNQGYIERYGKKIVVPGFEDIDLRLDQDNSVFELSTGQFIQTRSNTQKDIIAELEKLFTDKDIRKVIEDITKIPINQPGTEITSMSGKRENVVRASTEGTIQPGAYVTFNNETFIVTKKNATGTWQIYDPTKEGTAAKKSVAEKNLVPVGPVAKIVTYKDQEYIVTPKQTIISLTTNKAMQWGEENGDRKAILALAQGTVTEGTVTGMTSEQWQQELSDIYSSKERTEGKREWIIQQLNFRDQSRSMGATDEQILNTIKCL